MRREREWDFLGIDACPGSITGLLTTLGTSGSGCGSTGLQDLNQDTTRGQENSVRFIPHKRQLKILGSLCVLRPLVAQRRPVINSTFLNFFDLELVMVLIGVLGAAKPNYDFEWLIQDSEEEYFANHGETRHLDFTKGFYKVLRPNGVIDTITYVVNGDSGFLAQINGQPLQGGGSQERKSGESFKGFRVDESKESFPPFGRNSNSGENSHSTEKSGFQSFSVGADNSPEQQFSYFAKAFPLPVKRPSATRGSPSRVHASSDEKFPASKSSVFIQTPRYRVKC
ncbi:unnamed protein product [Darwinula stevensoni]|uniref:Uncharacterized protein n=1 Tax=Darwinula stevensoni TaxID=69355 RepID=A0A7R8WYJ8_9CRUS|nr:unnamed protein product [Darwinula stevensoni]CAG0879482.1 unnamed protein product [Darwinula stevensoni]